MKIYNKKTFWRGVIHLYFAVYLGIRLVERLAGKAGGVGSVVLVVFFFGILGVAGADEVRHGISKKLAKEDKLEAEDERNCLIRLKSNSRAHIITQAGCGILTAVFWGIGLAGDIEWMKGAALSATICYALSLFSEVFAQCYFEKNN